MTILPDKIDQTPNHSNASSMQKLTEAAASPGAPAEPSFVSDENVYLTLSTPGLLDTLKFHPSSRQSPGPGEVEIAVGAAGLNFKEVLLALGLMPISPDTTPKFGLECAGEITALGAGVEDFAIGDDVIAFGAGCFSRWITTPARLVAHRPAHLSLEETATIPIAFATAYYALITVGRLSRGDRLLIHSAAGGVGQAAVEIAQWVGADIFATAGNSEKREFLKSQGIAHVMDSRSVAFADDIMRVTGGQGVDVVLNSLSGEFIPKSLAVLRRYGRFLELGQRDILNDTPLGLGAFEKRLSFFAIQVEPEAPGFDAMWRQVVQHFHDQHFKPLPYQVFPAAKAAQAFGRMAEAKHIGKVVISLENCSLLTQLTTPQAASSASASTFPKRHGELNTTQPDQQALRDVISTPSVHSPAAQSTITPTLNIFSGDLLKAGLSPADGIVAFRRILASKSPQILVSTQDLSQRLSSSRGSYGMGSEAISDATDTPHLIEETTSLPSSHPRPQLKHEYVAPRNPLEETIAAIWKQFLGVSQVGVHDSFFELGGHSLMATQVMAQMGAATQLDLSLNTLFEHATVAAAAEYVEQARCAAQTLQTPVNDDSDDRAEIEL